MAKTAAPAAAALESWPQAAAAGTVAVKTMGTGAQTVVAQGEIGERISALL